AFGSPIPASSVQTELVPLGIGHDDKAPAEWWLGFEAAESGRPQRDEPLGFSLERCHPLVACQPGSRADIEMDAVLGDLTLGHLLEEQARARTDVVCDARPRLALLVRDAHPGQVVLPRAHRMDTRGH